MLRELDICGYLIQADADVQSVADLESAGAERVVIRGRGGTDFGPALKKAEELRVDAVVYFTDLCGRFPPPPRVPVIWVSTRRRKAPFGEVVMYDGRA